MYVIFHRTRPLLSQALLIEREQKELPPERVWLRSLQWKVITEQRTFSRPRRVTLLNVNAAVSSFAFV